MTPYQRPWVRMAILMLGAGLFFAFFGVILLLCSQLSPGFRLAFKGLDGGIPLIVIGNVFLAVGVLCWLLRPVYIR